MKLVRKNDEFIVIENNGSYHKVALAEIDDLIVLLCEAKRVDAAKANKSIGENLFEDQERTTRVFGQYVNTLHRDYDRVRRVMGIPMKDIYAKLKGAVEEHRNKGPMDDDKFYDSWVEATKASREIPQVLEHSDTMVMVGEPNDRMLAMMDKWVNNNRQPTHPFNRPVDVILGVDPSTDGDMTMSIIKGRQGMVNANGQQRPDKNEMHLFYGDLPITRPIEDVGVSFSIRTPIAVQKTPLEEAMIKTFDGETPNRVSKSPYLYGNPKKPGIGMFENLFIPRQSYKSDLKGYLERHFNYRGPAGSPLRNPLIGGKRLGITHWPSPAVLYWPVLAAFNDRMRRQDEARYVATAFPKAFSPLRHKLPMTLYTADVAYFVLTGNSTEDITSLNQIRSKAVKAWEC